MTTINDNVFYIYNIPYAICNIVMLEAYKLSIPLFLDGDKLRYDDITPLESGLKNIKCQNLYVTINVPVKLYDYVYIEGHLNILQCIGFMDNGDIECNNGLPYLKDKCKPVIATTDKEFTEQLSSNSNKEFTTQIKTIPSLSEDFVKTFVKAYAIYKDVKTMIQLENEVIQQNLYTNQIENSIGTAISNATTHNLIPSIDKETNTLRIELCSSDILFAGTNEISSVDNSELIYEKAEKFYTSTQVKELFEQYKDELSKVLKRFNNSTTDMPLFKTFHEKYVEKIVKF